MDRLSENKIIVVVRKTRLEELIVRFNTISQAKFYIEHLGADFLDYSEEDFKYKRVVSDAKSILSALGRVQTIDRAFLPNFIFGKNDLVVAIGQDGLVANTLKYLTNQLLIGINPDSSRWDGVLLPFEVIDLEKIVPEVFRNQRSVKEVTMAKVTLNDGQKLYAVNDLFIGQKTHVSARYEIRYGSKKEQHSSSGIIVSTGLGSTGWLKSIINGAATVVNSISSKNLTLSGKQMEWNTDHLYFSVREPFPSKATQAGLVFGKVTTRKPLIVVSLMPENGVIFSDGIESDFINFNSGLEAKVTIAEKTGHLVI